jgi:hypothetical protein
VTLCAPDEVKKLRAVERLIRVTLLPGGDPRPQREPTRSRPSSAPKPPAKPLDPARADRARTRRPRRTRRAA